MSDDLSDMFGAYADLLIQLAPLREACVGYRTSLVTEHGFSPEAAKHMTIHFHDAMMANFRAQLIKASR